MAEQTKNLIEHYEGFAPVVKEDFRADSITELVLKSVQGPRVLDLGCGNGAMSLKLRRQNFNVVSSDVSSEMLSMCRALLKSEGFEDAQLVHAGVMDLPFHHEFNSITCLDVIEHIEDDRAALKKIGEMLLPAGQLIISVPALAQLYGPKDRAVGHFRRYEKKNFIHLLDEAGFQVDSIRWWNFIGVLPVYWSVKRNKAVAEDFRYGARSWLKRSVNEGLRQWFHRIENPFTPPIGLSLIAVAKPKTHISLQSPLI